MSQNSLFDATGKDSTRLAGGGSAVVLGSAVSGMIGASGALMVSAGGNPHHLTIMSGASWVDRLEAQDDTIR
jgi:hypothetical protein